MRKISIIFSIIILATFTSCRKAHPYIDIPIEIEEDGVNLSLTFSLADFNIGSPDVGTRSLSYSERIAKIEKDEIHSLAVFIMKEEEVKRKVIAYRIFLDHTSAGHDQKYFFKNIDHFKYDSDDPNTTEDETTIDIKDIPIIDVLYGIDPANYSATATMYAVGNDDADLASSFDIDPNTGNPVCGINQINPGNKTAEVHFDYMHPLHGKTEKLRAGRYHLIAFANFRESPSFFECHTVGCWIKESIGYWLRHESEEGFEGISSEPVFDENAEEGIYQGFKYLAKGRIHLRDATVNKVETDVDPTLGFIPPSHDDVITSSSYMRNAESDVISTYAGIAVLAHGETQHNVQMLRTVSRATFNINNQGNLPIKIIDFSLSDNFSSAATYLMPFKSNLNNPLKNSPTWIGAPVVTSDRAILKFDNTVEYPASSAVTTFFDALLLDVRDDNPLYYTIDIQIPSIVNGMGYSSEESIQTVTMLNEALASEDWEVGTGRLFLMRNNVTAVSGHTGKQMFIKYNGTSTYVDKEGSNNDTEYSRIADQVANYGRTDLIWEFIKVSSTEIKIKNLQADKYLKAQGNNQGGNTMLYTEDINQASVFTLHNYKGSTNTGVSDDNIPTNTVAFTTITTGEVYMNILQASGECVTCAKWNDWGSHFFIYPVSTHPQLLHKRLDISVTAFDDKLGESYTLNTLHRNEHLNVQINVAFNDKSQDIEVETLAFTKKDNTIEFH